MKRCLVILMLITLFGCTSARACDSGTTYAQALICPHLLATLDAQSGSFTAPFVKVNSGYLAVLNASIYIYINHGYSFVGPAGDGVLMGKIPAPPVHKYP